MSANLTLARRAGLQHPQKKCRVCFEDSFEDDPENWFIYECSFCQLGVFCAKCLKQWFIEACKNESNMPPSCCRIVPIYAVSAVLQTSEIELYKAKFEEWNTTDRLYCPVPTCSTFIAPRLFWSELKEIPEEDKSPSTRAPEEGAEYDNNGTRVWLPGDPIHHYQFEVAGVWDALPYQTRLTLPKVMQPEVNCPTCGILICTTCHYLKHPGDCSTTDLDPELEAQLNTGEVKRCPKCRIAVQKIDGCLHMRCKCSAEFCWNCLRPYNVCNRECEARAFEARIANGNLDIFEIFGDDEGEDEINDNGYEVDSARSTEGSQQHDGHETGDQPLEEHRHIQHDLRRMLSTDGDFDETRRCLVCVKRMKPAEPLQYEPTVHGEGDNLPASELPLLWPTDTNGEPVWQCGGGHFQCYSCPRLPPSDRVGDETRIYKCDCNIACGNCMDDMKPGDIDVAFKCACGFIVCGECKDAELE